MIFYFSNIIKSWSLAVNFGLQLKISVFYRMFIPSYLYRFIENDPVEIGPLHSLSSTENIGLLLQKYLKSLSSAVNFGLQLKIWVL